MSGVLDDESDTNEKDWIPRDVEKPSSVDDGGGSIVATSGGVSVAALRGVVQLLL
jgi:hypothetical protein